MLTSSSKSVGCCDQKMEALKEKKKIEGKETPRNESETAREAE
jgi:hypothetical protein